MIDGMEVMYISIDEVLGSHTAWDTIQFSIFFSSRKIPG
jgi:hypothetical protein